MATRPVVTVSLAWPPGGLPRQTAVRAAAAGAHCSPVATQSLRVREAAPGCCFRNLVYGNGRTSFDDNSQIAVPWCHTCEQLAAPAAQDHAAHVGARRRCRCAAGIMLQQEAILRQQCVASTSSRCPLRPAHRSRGRRVACSARYNNFKPWNSAELPEAYKPPSVVPGTRTLVTPRLDPQRVRPVIWRLVPSARPACHPYCGSMRVWDERQYRCPLGAVHLA